MARQTGKPDTALVKEQLAALQAMLQAWGVELFCASMFWILTKEAETFLELDEPTNLVPFRFNRIQKDLFPKLGRNNLFLKPRQVGGTTFFLLVRLLLNAITNRGIGCQLVSQNNEYAEKHFKIVKRAYKYIGAGNPLNDEQNQLCRDLKANLLHVEYSNKRELIFDQIESRVMVASAEVEEAGQGVTLHHLLCSEYSRWPKNPEETLSNVRGALVKRGTTDKECTANSASGPFYEDCMRAMNNPEKSDALLHYYSWWWQDEYFLALDSKQKKEMELDLRSDELLIIAKIHKELSLGRAA